MGLRTRTLDALRDEHGTALPLALMVLIVVAALTAAFVAMGTTEPIIANNLKQGNQALALAEAGVEKAIWAMSPALAPAALANPLPAPVPPDYNGITQFNLTASGDPAPIGVFNVTVSNPPAGPAWDRNIVSTGCVPDCINPQARRVVATTVENLAFRFQPPGAVNVNGQLLVSGSANVRSSGNVCGKSTLAVGTYSSAGTDIQGNGQVTNDSGTSSAKTGCVVGCSEDQPASTFDPMRLSPAELNMLKEMAKASGGYYKGDFSHPVDPAVVTNSIPNGLVFVDTYSGNAFDVSNPSDFASVQIQGGTSAGWLIVMGSISTHGNLTYSGLIYAADDFKAGNGTVDISGAVITHNARNSTVIDTSINGDINITYNCNALETGGGKIPQGFFLKPGTWREVQG